MASWDQSVAGPWYSFARLVLGIFGGRLDYDSQDYLGAEFQASTRESFVKHYEDVRMIAKKKNVPLLEFRSEDGWKPLCEFLGEKVPEGEYPRINETKDFINLHRMIWLMAFGKMVAKTVGPIAVAIGAFHWWYGWDWRALL